MQEPVNSHGMLRSSARPCTGWKTQSSDGGISTLFVYSLHEAFASKQFILSEENQKKQKRQGFELSQPYPGIVTVCIVVRYQTGSHC